MLALALLALASYSIQKPAVQKPAKPPKPAPTKPAKPAGTAPVQAPPVTLEQLAPEESAVVFAAPSLAALDRAIAPARAWLGGSARFVETLSGLALPAGALDPSRPLLVAGAVEGQSTWTWTIVGTPASVAKPLELPPPWRRLEFGGYAVWTQREKIAPTRVAATDPVDPSVDLSIRIDVMAAVPVIEEASAAITAILGELAPSKDLPGPYAAAPRLVFSAFMLALANSERGTLDVRDGQILWTGVPRAGAAFEAMAAGEPRDLAPLACWIDPEATSWFIGRANPEAPLSAAMGVTTHWSGLGGRDTLPTFKDTRKVSAFGRAVAIGRTLRGVAPMDRVAFDTADAASTAEALDPSLFRGLEDVADARIETKAQPWGEVRAARIPIDSRTIDFLDPGNPGKTAELIKLRVETLKRLHGGDDVRRVRAIRDGRVVLLLGAVAERDEAALGASLPDSPRPDVAAAIAELKGYPSGFASSMDLGAQLAGMRAALEEIDIGDRGDKRRMADKVSGPALLPGKFVVQHLGGYGPDSLFLRVRTDFTLLLGPLGAERQKRVAREEAGRLGQTAEHKKIADDLYMLHGAATAYRDNNQKWPASLADLGKPDAQGLTYLVGDVLPVDPWGRAYAYRIEGKSAIVATFGADGAQGGTWMDTDVEKVMH